MQTFSEYSAYMGFRTAIPLGKTVGFVPTMGALHEGHLSLVKRAKQECDYAVVSIYVNKRQFNDPVDFEKYPRDLEHDLELLAGIGCDAVFTPESENELYQAPKPQLNYNLNGLDTVLEGAHRPKHFDAVVEVVERLFATIQPTHAFFGLKDYQQYRIIKSFTEHNNLPVQVMGHKTVREEEGLAMSSRNQRLTNVQHEAAHGILRCLHHIKQKYNEAALSLPKIIDTGKQELLNIEGVTAIDYLQIADADTLQPVTTAGTPNARAFAALHLGNVRLIDNISLNP